MRGKRAGCKRWSGKSQDLELLIYSSVQILNFVRTYYVNREESGNYSLSKVMDYLKSSNISFANFSLRESPPIR